MAASTTSQGRVFRLAASRLFMFLVGVGVPIFSAIIFIRDGQHVDWRSFLLGIVSLVPTSIILAGVVSLLYPSRLTEEGIHAQSAMGLPSFVRWQDIRDARKFTFLNLSWLRIYSSAGAGVTWLALFQSPSVEFKHELQRLAPPGNPVLGHLN